MQLTSEQKNQHWNDISSIYAEQLHTKTTDIILFGKILDSKLISIAGIANYDGEWYLRGCYVLPEYRGKGLQLKLIEERIQFAKNKGATEIRVAIDTDNTYSLHNCIKAGFVYEKDREISKIIYQVYKLDMLE